MRGIGSSEQGVFDFASILQPLTLGKQKAKPKHTSQATSGLISAIKSVSVESSAEAQRSPQAQPGDSKDLGDLGISDNSDNLDNSGNLATSGYLVDLASRQMGEAATKTPAPLESSQTVAKSLVDNENLTFGAQREGAKAKLPLAIPGLNVRFSRLMRKFRR